MRCGLKVTCRITLEHIAVDAASLHMRDVYGLRAGVGCEGIISYYYRRLYGGHFLLCDKSSIHDERCAGRKSCIVGTEIENRCGDLFAGAYPPDRDKGLEGIEHLATKQTGTAGEQKTSHSFCLLSNRRQSPAQQWEPFPSHAYRSEQISVISAGTTEVLNGPDRHQIRKYRAQHRLSRKKDSAA
jgi:hypothetical protein